MWCYVKVLTTYVALLRGVNVGGRNKLPMKELADIFTAAGCDSVRTYIQSGNVIFRADTRLAAELPSIVSARIDEHFGHKPKIILRSAEELGEIIHGNPFLRADEVTMYIMFLADTPTPEAIQKLDPDRSPPDRFKVRGANVYMWLKNSVADTKLTNAYFDTKLATIGTGRNWRTVQMVYELMSRPKLLP